MENLNGKKTTTRLLRFLCITRQEVDASKNKRQQDRNKSSEATDPDLLTNTQEINMAHVTCFHPYADMFVCVCVCSQAHRQLIARA